MSAAVIEEPMAEGVERCLRPDDAVLRAPVSWCVVAGREGQPALPGVLVQVVVSAAVTVTRGAEAAEYAETQP